MHTGHRLRCEVHKGVLGSCSHHNVGSPDGAAVDSGGWLAPPCCLKTFKVASHKRCMCVAWMVLHVCFFSPHHHVHVVRMSHLVRTWLARRCYCQLPVGFAAGKPRIGLAVAGSSLTAGTCGQPAVGRQVKLGAAGCSFVACVKAFRHMYEPLCRFCR